MSVEVATNLHHFKPNAQKLLSSDSNNPFSANVPTTLILEETPLIAFPFIPHYLHDVESLWWIGIFSQSSTVPKDEYEIMLNVEKSKRPSEPSPFARQLAAHNRIFALYDRLMLLTNKDAFAIFASTMPPSFQKGTLRVLTLIREWLEMAYREYEKTFSTNGLGDMYVTMAKYMALAGNNAVQEVVPLRPPLRGTKRTVTAL